MVEGYIRDFTHSDLISISFKRSSRSCSFSAPSLSLEFKNNTQFTRSRWRTTPRWMNTVAQLQNILKFFADIDNWSVDLAKSRIILSSFIRVQEAGPLPWAQAQPMDCPKTR